jgi:hypothetical protein
MPWTSSHLWHNPKASARNKRKARREMLIYCISVIQGCTESLRSQRENYAVRRTAHKSSSLLLHSPRFPQTNNSTWRPFLKQIIRSKNSFFPHFKLTNLASKYSSRLCRTSKVLLEESHQTNLRRNSDFCAERNWYPHFDSLWVVKKKSFKIY